MSAKRVLRSDRLLAALEPYEPVLVVTHDNPDPDAIAAGWALHTLVRERLQKKVRLVGGGEIVRAENEFLVRLLDPPIELIQDDTCPEGAGVVLVDCNAGGRNHVFCHSAVPIVAVIDHHVTDRRRGAKAAFFDQRPNVAACASIASSYLKEQKIEPGAHLATALWYALRTETRGGDTRYSRLDRTMLLWLIQRANPTHLAEIEDAPLRRAYFGDLMLALQGTFLYDDAALCMLPRAAGAEIVGEVADLLIRCEGIRRVLCGAMVEDDLFLSIRTEPGAGDATSLVHCVLAGLGHGGGHEHRAGGKIPGAGSGAKINEELQDDLRNRWIEACRVDRQRGTRLVPRREIVENL